MAGLTPIQTEYKGIRFRSKSEAVFARCLNLVGHDFTYEPSCHSHDWDFEVIKACEAGFCVWLIEYKPSEPTDVYLENLANKIKDSVRRFRLMAARAAYEGRSHVHMESFVVFGNPWNGCYVANGIVYESPYMVIPIFTGGKNGDYLTTKNRGSAWWRDTFSRFGISDETAKEALRYRFDLK